MTVSTANLVEVLSPQDVFDTIASVHEPVVSFSPQKYVFGVFQKPTVEIKDL